MVQRGEANPRVRLLNANQSDVSSMEKLVQGLRGAQLFDIIIEDGSHLQRDQQLNWAQLFPLVKPGGVYVIEDISSGNHGGYDEKPYSNRTTLAIVNSFRKTGRLQSPHLSKQQAEYLERWTEKAVPVVTRYAKWDQTCLVSKRMSPKAVESTVSSAF